MPVDLNSIMHMNYMSLAEFYSLLGDAEKSEAYLDKADALQKAIQSVLWAEEESMWFDYDFFNSVIFRKTAASWVFFSFSKKQKNMRGCF